MMVSDTTENVGPKQNTPLVEMHAFIEAQRHERYRAFIVHGPPNRGKTAFARKLAAVTGGAYIDVLATVAGTPALATTVDVLDVGFLKGRKRGEVWMRDFRAFQVGTIDLEYYIECRRYFTLNEWRDLLVSSMGFNPVIHTERQKMLLITRMLPFAEPRVNLVEPAPKGTGKSFVYDNLW